MSRVEIESYIKSFLLFFSSLSILISTLFYFNYQKNIKTLDDTLFSQMRVCSFELKCTKFEIDFIPIETQELYRLYKNKNGLDGYFPISKADRYYIKLHFEKNKYQTQLDVIKNDNLINYFFTLAILALLSAFFSAYTLSPLRNALLLTQEFIKDILHDFNTPLSSLRLNSAMLKMQLGGNEKVSRIEQSVENILSLQENLKAYLYNHEKQNEKIDINKLISEKTSLIQKNYPDIKIYIDIKNLSLYTNIDAFSRIMDNIITNGVKYNKKNGTLHIKYEKNKDTLYFIDTGKGIKNPTRIFERFYKEQDRGIGIGLHIVKKLCDELDVEIKVKSELGRGSEFSLNLSKLTHR